MLERQIRQNKQRTVFLIAIFFALLSVIGAGVGYLLLGSLEGGAILALVIGVIYAVSMIFQSTGVVMSMNKAREVTAEEYPVYYRIVEDMAMVAQVPMPRVFVIDDSALNAFATGSSPENAAVAATTGLLEVMTREELEGVMGHEISHIRNYDIRISTIAVALASAVTLIASIGGRMMWYGGGRSRSRNDRENGNSGIFLLLFAILAMILAPLGATLLQLAISREREFLADAGAVELTQNPLGMIKALQKLDQSPPMFNPVDKASAAIYISNPLKKQGVQELFQTHPPIADRIAKLQNY